MDDFESMDVEAAAQTDTTPVDNTKPTTQNEAGFESFDDVDFEAQLKEETTNNLGKLKKGEEPEGTDVDKLESKEEDEEKPASDEKKEDEGKEKVEDKKAETPVKKGKALTGKLGEDSYDLDPDMVLRVKSDGKFQEMTLSDIINRAGGDLSVEKRLEEVSTQRKEVEAQAEDYKSKFEAMQRDKDSLTDDLRQIVEEIKNPNSPFSPIKKLFDLMGMDSLEYEKRAMEAFTDMFEEYALMDDTERENYWFKKENEYLKNHKESSTKTREQETSKWQIQREVDQMREARGVTRSQFADAFQTLVEAGVEANTITAEMVLEQAEMGPLFDQAAQAVEPFRQYLQEEGLADMIEEFAYGIRAGTFTPQDISEILKDELRVSLEGELEEKNKPLPKKVQAPKHSETNKDNGEPLDFDDFDDYGR